MKKIVLLSLIALFSWVSVATEEKPAFAELRVRITKVVPGSEEDFKLGAELIGEMRKAAMTKKLIYGKKYVLVEPVTYRSGRLYVTEKYWFDHNLFNARDVWDGGKTQFKFASVFRSCQLLREAGIEGFTMIVGRKSEAADAFSAAIGAMNGADPEHPMYLTPTLHPGKLYGKLEEQIGGIRACCDGSSLKYDGRTVVSTYAADEMTPEATAEYIRRIEQLSDRKIAYVHQVGSLLGAGPDPYHEFMERRAVRATQMIEYYDLLCRYLEVCDGLEFCNRLTERDTTLSVDFYENVILPVFGAACADPRYNGKKLFRFRFMAGYTNFLGSQTLSRDGTRTLRSYLEMCRRYPIDVLYGFEWDETNEDTCLEPTVCKPYSSTRILRYYSALFRNEKPTPLPGDDRSLPNLIVSAPRQPVLGRDFEMELVNVPDGTSSERYAVKLEIVDEKGGAVLTTENLVFKADELSEQRFTLPAYKIADVRTLSPRLTIRYRGRTVTLFEGFPASVVRTTCSPDFSWLCTPLRNVMWPGTKRVEWARQAGSPPFCDVALKTSLNFPNHPLNMVEVVQNSMDVYAYDLRNEYLQNDPDRVTFLLAYDHYVNESFARPYSMEFSIENAPSAVRFESVPDPGNRYLVNHSALWRQIPWNAPYVFAKTTANCEPRYLRFSLSKADVGKAVLHVKGTHLAGKLKGGTFAWDVPLAGFDGCPVKSKVMQGGLNFTLTRFYRVERLPLPINAEAVDFSATVTADVPDAVLQLRAVSRDGRVWWSRPFIVNADGKEKIPVMLYHDKAGVFRQMVARSRVPHIEYEFTPVHGDLLVTAAGREYYAPLGAFTTAATGFAGGIQSREAKPGNVKIGYPSGSDNDPAPQWEKLENGKYALRFDGRSGNFINFPPTVIPQRAGFTIDFEVKPEEVTRDQVYFAQYSPNYLSGFELATRGGKFHVTYKHRKPHDLASKPWDSVEHTLAVGPEEGKWNAVRFVYDGKKVTVSVNGKSDSFAQNGISQWLPLSGFGGDGRLSNGKPQWFCGLLRSFRVIHAPMAEINGKK